MTSVAIPNSVTNIGGEGAFAGCTGLSSLTIPNIVSSIGNNAFQYCTGLTKVIIPNGVTRIGLFAFGDCAGLKTLTIPNSVTNIGQGAFEGCSGLTSVYFAGSAPGKLPWPSGSFSIFDELDSLTIYYQPDTLGWGSTFEGHPAVLWDPEAPTSDPTFGVSAGKFGFIITGADGLEIVVETTTDLANTIWIALSKITLTGGSVLFTDPDSANHPIRFYRFRSP